MQSLSERLYCLRATATTEAASTTSGRTPTSGLPQRTVLRTPGIATSTRAIGRATGTTPTRQTASPSAASRTDNLVESRKWKVESGKWKVESGKFMRIERFEDIIAWQKAKELAVSVYIEFSHSRDDGFKDQNTTSCSFCYE